LVGREESYQEKAQLFLGAEANERKKGIGGIGLRGASKRRTSLEKRFSSERLLSFWVKEHKEN